MPPENSSETNIGELGVERLQPIRRVYVSAFIEGLDDLWPNFDRLRAEGITIDSDYPFIGASRTGRDAIAGADLFLGIYGFERKGRIGDIQEKEYKMAREKGKPVLAFVHSGYLYNAPPIGVFDLLSLPQDHLTKLVSFGPHEILTAPVLREVRRFFANGSRFDASADREAEVADESSPERLERTKRNQDYESVKPRSRDSSALHEFPSDRAKELSQRLLTARELREARRFDEAQAVYSQIIKAFPKHLDARLGRAAVLRETKSFSEALADYSQLLESFPGNMEARLGRAEVLRDLKRFDEALTGYSQVIESFPESLEARVGRAEVLRDMKRLEEALVDYGWVIKARPKDEEALATYAEVVREIAEGGHAARADQISENTGRSAEPSELASETIPAQGGSQPDGSEASPSERPLEERIGSILEGAAQVQDQLGKSVIDTPMMLIGLLDREDDRVARAFLSSFGITREKLFGALKTHYLKVILREATDLVTPGGKRLLTHKALRVFIHADVLAQFQKEDEVKPRHLFQALMRPVFDDQMRAEVDWIETTLGKDVAGWIAATLEEWDDATPITQAAVQAKMIEDDLFVNPATQRDSAAEKDLLGFEEYAEALVQIIRRPETRAPLVVGVYGPWGSGKSTFMGLVKRKLDALGQSTEPEPRGPKAFIKRQGKRLRGLFRKGERSLRVTTVDYDAWAYADAQKLWSGLVDKIAKELDAELTARDRIAYLINSHSRRLLAALALGLIPVALFLLGYAAQHSSGWLGNSLAPVWNKAWLSLPGWVATAAWALYAYFLQKRPVTDAVASLASRFDSAPSAGLVSRIQDEFKTALQTRIDPEKKPKTVEALRTDIRQRVERNELKVVVFIDELDRCPLEKIVEILEAIKLFLAEDIFIVLLGVDTRVAAEAIRLHYKEVQNPNLPREYLEKIVQLPLRVPTARKQHIETYLQSFMTLPEDGSRQESEAVHLPEGVTAQPSSGSNGDGETPAQVAVAEVTGNAGSAVVTVGAEENERVSRPAIVAAGTAPAENVAVEPAARTPYDASALSRSAALPQMPDTKIEFDAMAAIARDFLDSNPRRIKRLLNTYRYVKILAARLPGSQVQTARWQRTMLYWLAFTMKWPAFMSKAIEAAERPEAKDAPERFLHSRLKKGENEQSQPQPERIEKYLSLTAAEVVEHYKLAPNFLIENPNLDPKTQADELTPPNELPPALPFLGF